MKPRVATLSPHRRAIVRAITRAKAGEVVVQSPAPLNGGGIEHVGATAGLVDCHRPIRLQPWSLRIRIAAQGIRRNNAERRDAVVVACGIQGVEVKRIVPRVKAFAIEVRREWRTNQPAIAGHALIIAKGGGLRLEQDLQTTRPREV